MNRNKVLLIGWVGSEILTTISRNGSKRASIRLATHYRETNPSGQSIDHTVWHNIVAWNSTAAYAESSFVKGSKILVEGTIDYRQFKGRTGNLVNYTQIQASSLINLDR